MKHKAQTVTIETPEHIELQFVTAGIGARFLAYAVDRAIQAGFILSLLLAVGLVLLAMGQVDKQMWRLADINRSLGQWLIAGAILVYGLITMGYFMLFEFFWRGMTPGKRSLHIRVIRKDGRPLSFVDAAVRNIVRAIDIIGDLYPLGLIAMFVDSRNRRLGDLAAGTLVVVDRPFAEVPDAEGDDVATEPDPELERAATRMTAEDYHLVVRFLARRDLMDESARLELDRAIGLRLASSAWIKFERIEDVAPTLRGLATLYRRRMRIL